MTADAPTHLIEQLPKLAGAVAEHLGEGFQTHPLHCGAFSRCWLLSGKAERCVLRLRHANSVGVDSATEQRVLELLNGQRLAPETLFYDEPLWMENSDDENQTTAHSATVRLYRFVDGEQHDGMHIRQPDLLQRIGHAVARLHRIEAPELPPLQLADNLAALEERASGLSPSLQRLGEKAHAALGQMQVGSGLCHHDLWCENLVFCADGSVVLLDWEYARRGDALFDLANFIQTHSLTGEQISTLLAAAGYPEPPERLLPMRHLAEYLRHLWHAAYPDAAQAY